MTDYKALIERIEYFYVDVVEEFREAEQRIIRDSQFRSLFRKKDYDGNIADVKACKKAAQEIDFKALAVDSGDEESQEVLRNFKNAVACFKDLCDAHVQLQMLLKRKNQKEKISFFDYKVVIDKMNQRREAVNHALHGLDVVYTDYTEEHEYYLWNM